MTLALSSALALALPLPLATLTVPAWATATRATLHHARTTLHVAVYHFTAKMACVAHQNHDHERGNEEDHVAA
ncbi:hypothetical protein D3C85_1813980 [compost metagenome]